MSDLHAAAAKFLEREAAAGHYPAAFGGIPPRRALTLTQPWATLCVALRFDTAAPSKRIESRSWRPRDGGHIIGQPLLIHAAKHITPGLRHAVSDGTTFRSPYAGALMAAGYSPLDPWHKRYPDKLVEQNEGRAIPFRPLPLSALIGAVVVGGIVPASTVREWRGMGKIDALEYQLGDYDDSAGPRYGWILRDAWRLVQPIPSRGFQQLWHVEKEQAAALDIASWR